jgi:hypothetical protein
MVKRVATRLPEERILAMQQVGDRFCVPVYLSAKFVATRNYAIEATADFVVRHTWRKPSFRMASFRGIEFGPSMWFIPMHMK